MSAISFTSIPRPVRKRLQLYELESNSRALVTMVRKRDRSSRPGSDRGPAWSSPSDYLDPNTP